MLAVFSFPQPVHFQFLQNRAHAIFFQRFHAFQLLHRGVLLLFVHFVDGLLGHSNGLQFIALQPHDALHNFGLVVFGL